VVAPLHLTSGHPRSDRRYSLPPVAPEDVAHQPAAAAAPLSKSALTSAATVTGGAAAADTALPRAAPLPAVIPPPPPPTVSAPQGLRIEDIARRAAEQLKRASITAGAPLPLRPAQEQPAAPQELQHQPTGIKRASTAEASAVEAMRHAAAAGLETTQSSYSPGFDAVAVASSATTPREEASSTNDTATSRASTDASAVAAPGPMQAGAPSHDRPVDATVTQLASSASASSRSAPGRRPPPRPSATGGVAAAGAAAGSSGLPAGSERVGVDDLLMQPSLGAVAGRASDAVYAGIDAGSSLVSSRRTSVDSGAQPVLHSGPASVDWLALLHKHSAPSLPPSVLERGVAPLPDGPVGASLTFDRRHSLSAAAPAASGVADAGGLLESSAVAAPLVYHTAATGLQLHARGERVALTASAPLQFGGPSGSHGAEPGHGRTSGPAQPPLQAAQTSSQPLSHASSSAISELGALRSRLEHDTAAITQRLQALKAAGDRLGL
jgi:hypothetical protein